MMERKNLTLDMKSACIKADGAGGYSYEGYASKFNGVDSYGDTILPGAYASALKTLKVAGRSPKMFFNHKSWDLPIGKFRKVEEDEEGLFVAGTLTKGMALVEDIRLALADETLDGLSVGIGMKTGDYEWVDDPKSAISRIIKNVSALREISLVSFPADDKGRIDIDSVKSELDSIETVQDLEQFLREAGAFSKSAAAAVISRAKVVLHGDHGGAPEAKDAMKAALEFAGIVTAFKN